MAAGPALGQAHQCPAASRIYFASSSFQAGKPFYLLACAQLWMHPRPQPGVKASGTGAFILQSHLHLQLCLCAAMDAREALTVGIKGGAKNLGRDDLGEIAPGFAADFVAWKTDAIGFAGGLMDPVAALIYCTPSLGWVDLSVINGDVIVKNGELQSLDLKVRLLQQLLLETHLVNIDAGCLCQHQSLHMGNLAACFRHRNFQWVRRYYVDQLASTALLISKVSPVHFHALH